MIGFILVLVLLVAANLLRLALRKRKKKNLTAVRHFENKAPSYSPPKLPKGVRVFLPNGIVIFFEGEQAQAIYREFEKLLTNELSHSTLLSNKLPYQ